MNLVRVIVASCFSLLVGSGLIWWGWGLLFVPIPDVQSGGFSLVAGGSLLVAIGGVGLIYNLMKARAPARSSDRAAEPADTGFDADAPMERYLARRVETGGAPPHAAPAEPARPVFGRRPAPPQP